MENINAYIAGQIKGLRTKNRMTLRELADKVGITEATMQKYETNNIRRIDVEMIKRIANALEVSPEQLTGWDMDWSVPKEAQHAFDQYMRLSQYHRAIVNNLIDSLLHESEQ